MKAFSGQMMENTAILTIRYFVLCGLFYLVFYLLFRKRLARHKIQSHFPAARDHGRDILYSLSSILIFALVFSVTVSWPLPYTQLHEQPSSDVETAVVSFILMILVHDTYFYWTHRLIHTQKLYRHVHRVHHLSTNPSPWTAYAFHPAEAAIQALVMPLIAVLLPMHMTVFVFYFLFQFLHNIYGHLGFELLPAFVRNSSLGKLINTSLIHNSHHGSVEGNYGLYFTIWDRVMGTLKR